MPIVPFHNVGSVGLVADLPPHELPPEAWSSIKNIRFNENRAKKFLGHTQIFGTLNNAPRWQIPVISSGALFWIYGGSTRIDVTDGTTHKDISNGVYSMDEDIGWNGGVLNGVPIFNNGINAPQMWTIDFATPALMADLTAWPANTTAVNMRPFLFHLIALNVTKTSVQHPYMVKWSHPADPGTVPQSWDHTDSTKDAGEIELAETPGELLEQMPMREVNILYKTDSIWEMRFVGGNDIFGFTKMFGEIGAISQRCIQEYRGKHVVFGFDDVIIHDGQQADSLINNRIRRWLFNQIDGDAYKRSFIAFHRAKKEMWFCFPETGETQPTSALVWNILEDTFGHRELPNVRHLEWGILDTDQAETWDADAQEWNQDASVWHRQLFNPVDQGFIGGVPVGTSKFFRMDDTHQFDGTNVECFLERTGLAIVGKDRQGQPKVDYDSIKFVRSIRPKIESSGPILVSCGSQMSESDPITWQGPYSFDPTTDLEVFFTVTGRLIAVRFESTTNIFWSLSSYDLDLEVVSRY